MAFEPRLAEAPVADVSRFGASVSAGTWSCNVCDREYPVAESWLITYEPGYSLVACDDCAADARHELSSRN